MMVTYNTPDWYSTTDVTAYPRILPDADGGVKRATLAAITGAPTLAVGYPLAIDSVSNQFVPWSAGGTQNNDEIKAFLYPRAVDAHATDASLIIVLWSGIIHYDDIVLPAGETAADLKAALRTDELRKRGLRIDGLEDVGTIDSTT
jgi:hypothetical protein